MTEIEMDENLLKEDDIFKYSQHLNIKDFNRIIIKGNRNCLPRIILTQQVWKIITTNNSEMKFLNTIEQINYDNNIFNGLNYQKLMTINRRNKKTCKFLGHETLAPFCIKYNLSCQIIWKAINTNKING